MECLPTLTRLKSVQLLDGVVAGGAFDSNLKKTRRKRRGEKSRYVSNLLKILGTYLCVQLLC